MGRLDNNGYDRSKGSDRRAKRPTGKKQNWDELPAGKITGLIVQATRAGGAVRFGASRDGGALGLGVYGDGEPYTEWFRDCEELENFIDEMTALFRGQADSRE